MSIPDWLKPPAQRALEADASLCSVLADTSRERHGSDEATIRAMARDLVDRRGGEQASRLADLLVSQVQAVRRGL